jgi:hypothetical protein
LVRDEGRLAATDAPRFVKAAGQAYRIRRRQPPRRRFPRDAQTPRPLCASMTDNLH